MHTDPRWFVTASWATIAVGVLFFAGLLAILLVLARVPPLDALLGQVFDGAFFRRCLVVHVDLALVVWFHAFGAALCTLAARHVLASRIGAGLALLGIAGMVLAALVPTATPIIANYVPVLDHPLFLGGLVCIGAGLTLAAGSVDFRSTRHDAVESPALSVCIRFVAVGLLLSVATFLASAVNMPAGLPASTHYELLVWGGGHVLQVASYATLITAWIWMLDAALDRSPISPRGLALALGVMLFPWLAAPLLPFAGTGSALARHGFTTLMQLGIFPPVVVVIALCLRQMWQERDRLRLADPRVSSVLTGAGLALVGFVLGALISGSDTVVPGHYHASIGAVTVTLMGLTYGLMARLGRPLAGATARRWAARQPWIFGGGQLVFALGFAIASMPRKTYGSEQQVRDLTETVGLWIMGGGGLGAIAGGLLFLGLVTTAVLRRPAASLDLEPTWRTA